MKLYKLYPKGMVGPKGSPFDFDIDSPWGETFCHGTNYGFVVRANDEASARTLIYYHVHLNHTEDRTVWIDPELTVCEEITPEGKEEVILVNNYGA